MLLEEFLLLSVWTMRAVSATTSHMALGPEPFEYI